MVADRIKEICNEKRITIPQLADKIGVSKGFYTTLKNNTLRVDTLIKISEILEVPLKSFFDEGDLSFGSEDLKEKIDDLQKEINSLKEVLELKNDFIKQCKDSVFIHKLQMKIVFDYLDGLEGSINLFLFDSIKSSYPDIKTDKLLEAIGQREEYKFIQTIKHIKSGIKFLIEDLLKDEKREE